MCLRRVSSVSIRTLVRFRFVSNFNFSKLFAKHQRNKLRKFEQNNLKTSSGFQILYRLIFPSPVSNR